jgi:hypothetical protein
LVLSGNFKTIIATHVPFLVYVRKLIKWDRGIKVTCPEQTLRREILRNFNFTSNSKKFASPNLGIEPCFGSSANPMSGFHNKTMCSTFGTNLYFLIWLPILSSGKVPYEDLNFS